MKGDCACGDRFSTRLKIGRSSNTPLHARGVYREVDREATTKRGRGEANLNEQLLLLRSRYSHRAPAPEIKS